eukprot:g16293.t1
MVALVTFLSSFAGAKKFAMQAGYQVIAINELLALGFANLGGAVCGAVPTQIGLSRSILTLVSTRPMPQSSMTQALVALVLKLFSAYLFFVPRCVLNVIILLGAQHLTEFQHMRWLWSLRQTRTRQRTYLEVELLKAIYGDEAVELRNDLVLVSLQPRVGQGTALVSATFALHLPDNYPTMKPGVTIEKSRGLTDAGLSALNSAAKSALETYGSSEEGCLCQACGNVTDQSVVYAPCDHVYHAKCLGHWAALKKSEALQAVESSTSSVRSQRDALAREVAELEAMAESRRSEVTGRLHVLEDELHATAGDVDAAGLPCPVCRAPIQWDLLPPWATSTEMPKEATVAPVGALPPELLKQVRQLQKQHQSILQRRQAKEALEAERAERLAAQQEGFAQVGPPKPAVDASDTQRGRVVIRPVVIAVVVGALGPRLLRPTTWRRRQRSTGPVKPLEPIESLSRLARRVLDVLLSRELEVWCVAFLFTIVFGAFKGILGAVTVSLLMVLYQVADPPIARLGFCEERGRWMAVKAHHEVRQRLGVVAFRLEGPLFYANVERLEDGDEWLAEMEVASGAAGQPVKAVILSAAAMPFVDTTALESMKQLLLSYTQRNIAFLVSNVSGQPQKILQHVLGDLLPEGCLTSSWTTEDCSSDGGWINWPLLTEASNKHGSSVKG